jgi:nucleotide-binding universal stress UspA family protein
MRFLIAIDLENDGLSTLLAAHRLLGALPCTFDLLYVDPSRRPADFVGEPELREQALGLWERYRVRWQNKLEMTLFRLPYAARGKARVEIGDPATAILRLAPEYDGVVVGARNRGSVLRSSVPDRVVRGSPVPVVVVTGATAEAVSEPTTTPADDATPGVIPFRRLNRSSS